MFGQVARGLALISGHTGTGVNQEADIDWHVSPAVVDAHIFFAYSKMFFSPEKAAFFGLDNSFGDC